MVPFQIQESTCSCRIGESVLQYVRASNLSWSCLPWIAKATTRCILEFMGRQLLIPLFLVLFGFLTPSLATRLFHGRVPRLTSDNFHVLPHIRQSGETMTSISAGHIILTPTQPVEAGGHSGDRTQHLLTKVRAFPCFKSMSVTW